MPPNLPSLLLPRHLPILSHGWIQVTDIHITAHGTGAPNAPGKSETTAPGNAPVASDSGATNVGIDNSASNVPGEKGLKDVPISSTEPSQANANMK